MLRRELVALGIAVDANNIAGMSNFNATATNTGAVETFSLHPHSENINSLTVGGRKLYLAATKELSKEERIGVSIENRYNAKNYLETLSLKY